MAEPVEGVSFVPEHRRMVLSPKGIAIVEEFLVACEELRNAMGDVSPEGKAHEIVVLVDVCSSQISDVLEA